VLGGEGLTVRRARGEARWPTHALIVLAAVLALAGCRGGEEIAEPSPDHTPVVIPKETPSAAADSGPGVDRRSLMLRFNNVRAGSTPKTFVNSGGAEVDVQTVTWGPGQVSAARSPHGGALGFPAFSAKDPGFAILSVVSTGEDDTMSPADEDFAFGADFSIDRVTTGTPADDGDNLFQRGLYEGSGQYKIQIDNGRPSCRVAGLTGEVIVTAKARVTPGEWFRVRCTRHVNTVTLDVGTVPDTGPFEWTTTISQSAPIGTVIMPPHTPLSVGGKLAEDGTILPASTDQFNGSVDRVLYRVLR